MPTWQFWLSWIVQALAAIGTIAAVIVALFASRIQRVLFPPKLELVLKSNSVKTGYVLGDRTVGARWFHAQVRNPRRWLGVTKVKIVFLKLEEANPSGQFRPIWQGETIVRWEHPEASPTLADIGHPACCDLCCLVEHDGLQIFPRDGLGRVEPLWREATKIILTLQARGIEADSNLLRVMIGWDGKWSDDEDDMARHLSVLDVSASA